MQNVIIIMKRVADTVISKKILLEYVRQNDQNLEFCPESLIRTRMRTIELMNRFKSTQLMTSRSSEREQTSKSTKSTARIF